jgi:glycosyltransferase involved in cell wall biosynthesis
MKILHISSVRVDYPGGTEKVIWELARRQAKNNEVTILQTNLYEENEIFKREETREGVKIITVKNDFFLKGFGYSKVFKNKLKEVYNQYDVIHIHGHGRFTSNFAMGFLKKKKPFIYSAQGFFHDKKNSFFKRVYDFIYGSRLKNASFCTGLTILEKNKLIDFYGVPANKIRIVPGGMNYEDYQLKEKKVDLKKKYLGRDYKKKVLLYVGRIHESKGIQHVIDSIKDNEDLIFMIVGKDAGYLDFLRDKISELDIKDKVRLVGQVGDKELVEIYNLSDLFVLYSDWEGFGIVLVEAMAAGVPAIVSNKGSLPFLVKNNYNGFVVSNPADLKRRIFEVLSNNDLNKKLGVNSKGFAKKFDWDKISKKSIKLYKKAIEDFNEK